MTSAQVMPVWLHQAGQEAPQHAESSRKSTERALFLNPLAARTRRSVQRTRMAKSLRSIDSDYWSSESDSDESDSTAATSSEPSSLDSPDSSIAQWAWDWDWGAKMDPAKLPSPPLSPKSLFGPLSDPPASTATVVCKQPVIRPQPPVRPPRRIARKPPPVYLVDAQPASAAPVAEKPALKPRIVITPPPSPPSSPVRVSPAQPPAKPKRVPPPRYIPPANLLAPPKPTSPTPPKRTPAAAPPPTPVKTWLVRNPTTLEYEADSRSCEVKPRRCADDPRACEVKPRRRADDTPSSFLSEL